MQSFQLFSVIFNSFFLWTNNGDKKNGTEARRRGESGLTILNGWKNNRSNDNAWWRKKNWGNCMRNAFKIFCTILTGMSNFMSAEIRVSVKSDRYANAHGFFFWMGFSAKIGAGSFISVTFLWFFFSLSLFHSRFLFRRIFFYHFSFQRIYTFCSLYHLPKSVFRWLLLVFGSPNEEFYFENGSFLRMKDVVRLNIILHLLASWI